MSLLNDIVHVAAGAFKGITEDGDRILAEMNELLGDSAPRPSKARDISATDGSAVSTARPVRQHATDTESHTLGNDTNDISSTALKIAKPSRVAAFTTGRTDKPIENRPATKAPVAVTRPVTEQIKTVEPVTTQVTSHNVEPLRAPRRGKTVLLTMNSLPQGVGYQASMTSTTLAQRLDRQGFDVDVLADTPVAPSTQNHGLVDQLRIAATGPEGNVPHILERPTRETRVETLARMKAGRRSPVIGAFTSEPSNMSPDIQRVYGHIKIIGDLSGLQQELQENYATRSPYGHAALNAGELAQRYAVIVPDKMTYSKVVKPLTEVVDSRAGQPEFLREVAGADGKPRVFLARGGDRISEVLRNSMPEAKADAFDAIICASLGEVAYTQEQIREMAATLEAAQGIDAAEAYANGEIAAPAAPAAADFSL